MLRWSAGAALIYFVAALLIGEQMPFSRYDMFATTSHVRDASVPVALVDGAPVALTDFDRFAELDVERLFPPPAICHIGGQPGATAEWVRNHTVSSDTDGGVELALGYEIFHVGPEGLRSRIEVVTRGRAWPR